MDTKKIKIGDKEFELPVDIADAITAERDDAVEFELSTGKKVTVPKVVADYLETLKKKEDKPPKKEDKPPKTDDDLAALRAKSDANEAELKRMRDTEGTRIDSRVKLVRAVEDVCGSDVKTDGANDGALMREVILKVNPDLKDRLDANKEDAGYLRASFEAALDIHKTRNDAIVDTNNVLFNTHFQGGKKDDDDPTKSFDDYIAARNGDPRKSAKEKAAS